MTAHIPVHQMMDQEYRVPYTHDMCDSLTSSVEWITPNIAKSLRQNCHYERQRDLSLVHIRRLASEMKHGWFLQGTPIWFCVLPNDVKFIVNGNHTLEAVIESGVEIPLTFIYQTVDSLEEVAKAYACFDIQRSRTWMQAAQAQGLADEIPLAKHVLAALTHIIIGFNINGHNDPLLRSRPHRFNMMEEYKNPATMLANCLAGAPPANTKLVKRAGVMAVALVTMRYQPSSAENFWRLLVWDDGLRSNDPRKVLLTYLQRHDTVGQAATRDNIVASANCWNGAFDNRSMAFVAPGGTGTLSIKGTPWAVTNKDALNGNGKPPAEPTVTAGKRGRGRPRKVVGEGDGFSMYAD